MCICDKLRTGEEKRIQLDYDNYTSLLMDYGQIWANGEGEAYVEIKYCPFCGREFEKK